MAVAGIGAAGILNKKYQLSSVNVDDLVKSYKIRKASAHQINALSEKSVSAQRRHSYTGFAMHCDTAINFEHTSPVNGILTLSERVQNIEVKTGMYSF